ncbi:hypothetical protein SAMN02745178_00013 [Gemmiger formicilis]|uniref:Uncharacterized protein n=1 Tax=Gemmiger formicilis TaxID=745368 RepID=A0A1T4W728_9FIRM|nr:hypothetical protein SAMN02745178_00013 [Gemmiger formicilis]
MADTPNSAKDPAHKDAPHNPAQHKIDTTDRGQTTEDSAPHAGQLNKTNHGTKDKNPNAGQSHGETLDTRPSPTTLDTNQPSSAQATGPADPAMTAASGTSQRATSGNHSTEPATKIHATMHADLDPKPPAIQRQQHRRKHTPATRRPSGQETTQADRETSGLQPPGKDVPKTDESGKHAEPPNRKNLGSETARKTEQKPAPTAAPVAGTLKNTTHTAHLALAHRPHHHPDRHTQHNDDLRHSRNTRRPDGHHHIHGRKGHLKHHMTHTEHAPQQHPPHTAHAQRPRPGEPRRKQAPRRRSRPPENRRTEPDPR